MNFHHHQLIMLIVQNNNIIEHIWLKLNTIILLIYITNHVYNIINIDPYR